MATKGTAIVGPPMEEACRQMNGFFVQHVPHTSMLAEAFASLATFKFFDDFLNAFKNNDDDTNRSSQPRSVNHYDHTITNHFHGSYEPPQSDSRHVRGRSASTRRNLSRTIDHSGNSPGVYVGSRITRRTSTMPNVLMGQSSNKNITRRHGGASTYPPEIDSSHLRAFPNNVETKQDLDSRTRHENSTGAYGDVSTHQPTRYDHLWFA